MGLFSGSALRRGRVARGIKQTHLAELLCVNQATVSRWERGQLAPTPAQAARLRAIFEAAPYSASHDGALRRLVEGSAQRAHLVCDRTHRLLAASGPRWRQWRLERSELDGACMLAFASEDILRTEQGLEGLGWHEGRLGALEVETGANGRPDVPIGAGRFVWQQVLLSDGAVARLTIAL
jgi:transcriptional regulator with XRE-family HTH domain